MQKNKAQTEAVPARRKFILQSVRAVAAAALVQIPTLHLTAASGISKSYTVQEIISLILSEIPGAPFPNTVDTLKSGSPDQQVTGIVSCMFATIKVIEETAGIGANFIIAHEPTFYNHTDDTNWVPNNQVLKQKQDLLKKQQIAVWRFHDYWHSHRPDGIRYGVLKMAGWTEYDKDAQPVFNIPSTSLGTLVEHLKKSLGITHLRVLGDLNQACVKIALMPGAAGGQSQISLVEKEKPDVLIVGEVHEWETAEYIRDARQLGSKTALIILGHSVSEEPGMDWLVNWLQPKLQGVKVTHFASGDPFIWI
ncbi:MAG: Nif3-like dinuclear metal center hexameric protein [Chitinophagales bacterium]